MFTGIIETTAEVEDIRPSDGGRTLILRRPKRFGKLVKGGSIAVDGVCLTVCRCTGSRVFFDCATHTVALTRIKKLKKGDWVNLERPVVAGQEFGGHLVTGHVDGTAIVDKISRNRGYWLTVRLPAQLLRFCPERGSIAINGISLTIARVGGRLLSVMFIPTTLQKTTLGLLKVGDRVNIEVDIIARYLYNELISNTVIPA